MKQIATYIAGFLVLTLVSAGVANAGADESGQTLLLKPSFDDLNAEFTFPVTPAGRSYNACFELCFVDAGASFCNPARSGSVSLVQAPSSPFRVGDFTLIPIGSPCSTGGGTPVQLPAFIGPGQKLALKASFSPGRAGTYQDVLELRSSVEDIHLELSGFTSSRGSCTPTSRSLCLNDDRFQVTAEWTLGDGRTGDVKMVELTPDTGYLWFFNGANIEAMVKIIDGCALNDRFWVFAGGLTDVRVAITILDSDTNAIKTYTNPQGNPFEPIQDTGAFSCRGGRRPRA